MPTIRILIADDETLLRRLLRHKLADVPDFEVVGEANDGRQAVEQAIALRPDVVVMDLRMPGLNGVEATERILAQLPHVKVIIVTSFPELASLGKSWGAAGYLDKCCTPDELVSAIRQAHAAREQDPTAAPPPTDQVQALGRLAIRAGLTERERVVVEKVVGTELTIREIALALSNELGDTITPSAVTHTLERVMTKLRISPRTRTALVKYVLEFQRSQPEEPATTPPPPPAGTPLPPNGLRHDLNPFAGHLRN
jgi:DNA-binding NarL/FixJ family response regulator